MIKNYYDSVRKWEDFLKIVKERNECLLLAFPLIHPCGYCKEFDYFSKQCLNCPLFKDEICKGNVLALNHNRTIFWQIVGLLQRRLTEPIYQELEILTTQMLKEVKKHKDKFKKGRNKKCQ